MKDTIIFCAGMLFGASIMYLHMKNKKKMENKPDIFEDEDIEAFDVEPPVEEEDFSEVDPYDYKEIVKDYVGIDEEDPEDDGIYYITADEFGVNEDWDNIQLNYFVENDLVTDTEYSILSQPSKLVGNFKEHFGVEEPEDNEVVYVKNENLHCYYEIMKDVQNYNEILRPSRGILNEGYR